MGLTWDRVKLWLWARFFILLIAVGSGSQRRRMSHNNGIAGRGKLRIVDDPKFPAADFFEPGREWVVRLRHASSGYMDDAMSPVRSASIKFADTRYVSPFDLQLNTGRHCFFWNAASFLEFAFSRDEHEGVEYVKYHTKYADGRKSAADAQIKVPESFATMYYHSHTPFAWKAKDGVARYVRFRLIPGDRAPEQPPPNPEWVAKVRDDPALAPIAADQRAVDGETRDVNYLKNEWAARVRSGPVHYILQVQFHEVKPNDPDVIRNPLEPWDEATHPYLDMATVVIDALLSHKEQDQMAFEVTNMPASMDFLPARSMQDYNSLNYMRRQAVWAIRARRLVSMIFGLQKPIADGDMSVRNKRLPGM
ncbi:MAG: hypothetical protein J0I06_00170 [Planctomycetes bacterium]|nr:hypothetical protein [Planctomycetota bacterium]